MEERTYGERYSLLIHHGFIVGGGRGRGALLLDVSNHIAFFHGLIFGFESVWLFIFDRFVFLHIPLFFPRMWLTKSAVQLTVILWLLKLYILTPVARRKSPFKTGDVPQDSSKTRSHLRIFVTYVCWLLSRSFFMYLQICGVLESSESLLLTVTR